MGTGIRLDKYLTDMNQGSRTQMKEAARKGRILVNGSVEKKSERKIDLDVDVVTLDGRRIGYAQVEYYMLNKPMGVVSATEDNLHQTVIDLLEDKKRKDLFPVGRLDIDTEGLLLITNDGGLAHQLLSPKNHVDKVYEAMIEGTLPNDAAKRFLEGIALDEYTITRSADLVIEYQKEDVAKIHLTIREGKFHQVKRMFEALDCKVTYLKRISMGRLKLDERLKPGDYRELTKEELHALQSE